MQVRQVQIVLQRLRHGVRLLILGLVELDFVVLLNPEVLRIGIRDVARPVGVVAVLRVQVRTDVL